MRKKMIAGSGAAWALLLAVSCLADGMGLSISSSSHGQALSTGILARVSTGSGICVVLGDTQGHTALQIADSTDWLVYLQLADTTAVTRVSQQAFARGTYGTRLYVAEGGYDRINLADNLADVVIAVGDAAGGPGAVSNAVVLAALNPLGIAQLGTNILTKSYPAGTDDWSHFYHGPNNVPVSEDQTALAPYLTHYLAKPRYLPMPQATVTAGGRIFKWCGRYSLDRSSNPYVNSLVAVNGYNGTILWKQKLRKGFMANRTTIAATLGSVYIGDDEACRVFDAVTGTPGTPIATPNNVEGGKAWKWMAIEDDVLYGLVGGQERIMPTTTTNADHRAAWDWGHFGGLPFAAPYGTHPWQFGRTLFAMDLQTRKIRWRHVEDHPIDGRYVCFNDGRLFFARHGTEPSTRYIGAVDTASGTLLWKKTGTVDTNLFSALGSYQPGSGPGGWSTMPKLSCSDRALLISGNNLVNCVALSPKDGAYLWRKTITGHQAVAYHETLFLMEPEGGPDQTLTPVNSYKMRPETGQVLKKLAKTYCCTRITGNADSIWGRGSHGTIRIDISSGSAQAFSAMRPNCTDGAITANGLIYFFPWQCNCNMLLWGTTVLAPAGSFDFQEEVLTDTNRLEIYSGDLTNTFAYTESTNDWAWFRSEQMISTNGSASGASLLWQYSLQMTSNAMPTAPVCVDGRIFVGGSDGILRALTVSTNKILWRAYTGGPIRLPPLVWQGRVFVGSGDGYVYSYKASNGQKLWRYRAATEDRRIPVYGRLLSTWPVHSGIVETNGIVFFAAGLAHHDGTHLYALDAKTGVKQWHSGTSGALHQASRSGISAQGQIMLHNGSLWLAGGTYITYGKYDISDGSCLTTLPNCVLKWNENLSDPFGWMLREDGPDVKCRGGKFYHPDSPFHMTRAEFAELGKSVSTNYERVGWCSGRSNILVHTMLDGTVSCYQK